MSHIETASVAISDIQALKNACARLGVEFLDQKTYTWYGVSVGDYPVPEGLSKADLGKCDYAIRVPGVSYEVGVVANKKAPGFTLAYDFWGSDTQGRGLQKKFCNELPNGQFSKGMEKLVDRYSMEVLKRQAARKGFRSQEIVAPDGSLKLAVHC